MKGDVHDIGKNIVGVVLECNNYEIIDLGVMVPADRILRIAREKGVDIIGLSGLITPSLNEMVHVAGEMQREGFDLPLLIGGATTSRKHTAVKIAPAYKYATVHVKDASRATGVMGTLLNEEQRDEYVRANRESQQRALAEFDISRRPLISYSDALAHRQTFDWAQVDLSKPKFIGVQNLCDFPISQLVDFIDWGPFFHAWELRGSYPKILNDPHKGVEARKLFDDAQVMLQAIVEEGWIKAQAVYGFFPANADGDDIVVFEDERRDAERARLSMLRQQQEKRARGPYFSLADFVAPVGYADYIGAFALTAGLGVDAKAEAFKHALDDYNAILLQAMADRLAEAFAEFLHAKARRDWGYGLGEGLSHEDLIRERYRGIRPAPGLSSMSGSHGETDFVGFAQC